VLFGLVNGADGGHICLTNAPISNQSMQYQ